MTKTPILGPMGSGLGKESLMWLLDQGIKLIGTDAFTLDIPIPKMVEELKKGQQSGFLPHPLCRTGKRVYSCGEAFQFKDPAETPWL